MTKTKLTQWGFRPDELLNRRPLQKRKLKHKCELCKVEPGMGAVFEGTLNQIHRHQLLAHCNRGCKPIPKSWGIDEDKLTEKEKKYLER